jgi:hypothetical protein
MAFIGNFMPSNKSQFLYNLFLYILIMMNSVSQFSSINEVLCRIHLYVLIREPIVAMFKHSPGRLEGGRAAAEGRGGLIEIYRSVQGGAR